MNKLNGHFNICCMASELTFIHLQVGPPQVMVIVIAMRPHTIIQCFIMSNGNDFTVLENFFNIPSYTLLKHTDCHINGIITDLLDLEIILPILDL